MAYAGKSMFLAKPHYQAPYCIQLHATGRYELVREKNGFVLKIAEKLQ